MNSIRTNVIEFGHLGHQRQHLLNVVKGWRKYSNDRWSMRVTATPEFGRAHPDVEAAVAGCGSERVEFHVLRPDAAARLSEAPLGDRIPLSWIVPPGPPKNSLACSRWEIAQASASEHGANRLFLMNLDEQLISLAAHMEFNADVYGLVHAPPARGEGVGYRRRWSLHQRAIFTRALSHQRLRCIFSFDEEFEGCVLDPAGGGEDRHRPRPCCVAPASGPTTARRASCAAWDRRRSHRAVLFRSTRVTQRHS